jgi:hypothetical protein
VPTPAVDVGSIAPQTVGALRPARVAKTSLRYVGFGNGPESRDYHLAAQVDAVTIDYTLSIPHAAFASGRAKLQEGPEICYHRMLQQLLACGLDGPTTITISDRELSDYRDAHTPVPRGRPFPFTSSPPVKARP